MNMHYSTLDRNTTININQSINLYAWTQIQYVIQYLGYKDDHEYLIQYLGYKDDHEYVIQYLGNKDDHEYLIQYLGYNDDHETKN